MATGGPMTPDTNTTMAQYSIRELAAAVEEANRANVSIAAHALGTAGIRNAAAAGVTTIEHCNWLGRDGGVEFDESVAMQMADQGSAVVATLVPLQRAAPTLRERILDCMRQMFQLGVPFVGGTDAGTSLNTFDLLPNELEILVHDIGLTPLQAIHSATGGAARLLGLANVGILDTGRLADLIVVDGDSSVCIEDIRKRKHVIKGGEIVVENGVLLV